MTTSPTYSLFDVVYPESDGLPMAESDATRDYLIYGVEALDRYFQKDPKVYVSGNLFIYYEQGNPKAVVAPDVFVVLGVDKKKRFSYKTWEERDKMPDFILEITSKSTASQDRGIKKGLYAYLGVKEYFQYDPTADYLRPCLQGFRLMEGNYLPILGQLHGDHLSIHSETLGLELRLEADGEMRFYNPKTGEKLLSTGEMEQARVQAERRAEMLAAKLRELGFDPDRL
jgi:Uma2 family endonuclease